MTKQHSGLFKTSDGTDIWYQKHGKGPMTMVLCDGLACFGYIWKYFLPHFAGEYQVIHSQYRGHGQSAIPVDMSSITVDRLAQDTLELLEELVVKGPVLLVGHSMGVQVALECYRMAPKSFAGMILINGPYGQALKHVHNTGFYAKALPTIKQAFQRYQNGIQKIWRPLIDSEFAYLYAKFFEVNPFLTKRQDFRLYFSDLGSMDTRVYIAVVDGATQHSAEDMLGDIVVPVLVVAGDKDRFTPYKIGLQLHKNIPGSELMTMPSGSHIGPLELPEFLHLRVEKFLHTHFQAKSSPAKASKSSRSKG